MQDVDDDLVARSRESVPMYDGAVVGLYTHTLNPTDNIPSVPYRYYLVSADLM